MKDPKIIRTISEGASYALPSYFITDEGIQDGDEFILHLCKGNKDDYTVLRQPGVFTESLLQVCKEYLETVNTGHLSSREASIAITKIDEALMWLNKRSEDRKRRGVQSTYKK